jgi:hypothetical protein
MVKDPVVEKEVLAARVEAARAGEHTSWGYHSRASLAHRYVAMTVPKVACTTIKMPLAAVYDPQLARRVYDLYLADFETFGYHKDSWRHE